MNNIHKCELMPKRREVRIDERGDADLIIYIGELSTNYLNLGKIIYCPYCAKQVGTSIDGEVRVYGEDVSC